MGEKKRKEGKEMTVQDSAEEMFIESYIGGYIRWPQLLQAVLVSLASFFEAQQTFLTIFTDFKPSWHCKQPANITICNSQSNICQLPTSAWDWDRPSHTSIVSEWSLQCNSSPIVAGLPASSFFIGSLIGGVILGIIGDSIGRKKLLTVSCLIMSVAATFTAFSKNIWIYSFLRFLNGFGCSTIGCCVLVLSTECVGRQWRGSVGIMGFLYFTMGFLTLPAIAYLSRSYSWRTLYLLTALPAIIYCLCIEFYVFESPRWLLEQGRDKESLEVLNTFLSPESRNLLSDSAKLLSERNKNVKDDSNPSTVGDLLKNQSLLQRLLISVMIGLGIGIIYYGMPLSLGNLEFNIYISVAFNALLELPSSLMTLYLANYCKRKDSLLKLCITSGVCGVLCILLTGGQWRVVQVGLEMISFFSACTACDLLMIYVVELFPTSTRNSALMAVWQSMVFGGALSPVVIAAGAHYKRMLPDFIFGVVILVLGSFVVFLPETMNEQEQNNEAALPGV